MINTGTVLIGATFFSAGFASESEKDCLIIERRATVGSEFCASLLANPVEKSSDEFYGRLDELKIIGENGGIHTVPCAFVLSGYILEKKFPILLETEVLDIEKKGRRLPNHNFQP